MNTPLRNYSRSSFLFIVALMGCCAVLAFSSCSKKASAAIIGTWQAQATKEIIEFLKDGTAINPQNQKQNGKYIFTDGNHMNLEIDTGDTNEPVISFRCEVQIHGDKMDVTMTAPGNNQHRKVIFTRLK
ncbi:MAG TPA: hypothetical protein VIK35_04325 [Verrucomicrobiae bacterium]